MLQGGKTYLNSLFGSEENDPYPSCKQGLSHKAIQNTCIYSVIKMYYLLTSLSLSTKLHLQFRFYFVSKMMILMMMILSLTLFCKYFFA